MEPNKELQDALFNCALRYENIEEELRAYRRCLEQTNDKLRDAKSMLIAPLRVTQKIALPIYTNHVLRIFWQTSQIFAQLGEAKINLDHLHPRNYKGLNHYYLFILECSRNTDLIICILYY